MPETVRMRWVDNCLLIDDPMPVDLMGRLAAMFPKKAILDPHLARMAEAMNAVGMQEDTERLSMALEPAMRRKVDQKYPGLSAGAREWLAVGQHGASSTWLFWHITGVSPAWNFRNTTANPHDASDLVRVVDMLKLVQGNDSLPPTVADASLAWAALAGAWPELITLLREEKKSAGGKTPRTTALMQELTAHIRENR